MRTKKMNMIKYLFIIFTALLFSFEIKAQIIINDDFSTFPQGWAWFNTGGCGQYSGIQDVGAGGGPPSAQIMKTGCTACVTQAGFSKTVILPPNTNQFTFSVSYMAQSNTTISSVTNAFLQIIDNTNGGAFIENICLVCGGTTNSGWQFFSQNYTIACGTDDITVKLFSSDSWLATPWCRNTWFDNPFLNVTLTDCALPIELIAFEATLEPHSGVRLNWTTASESNNDFFTLEKTLDGITYQFVTEVKGAGNSNVILNYSYVDENSYNGTSYYRLKQTDYNGQYKYSNVISVVNDGATILTINHKLNTGKILITGIEQNSNLSIINLLGQSIFQTKSINEKIEIDLSNRLNGIYFIQIVSERGTVVASKKIIIHH